jgi:hypothetical protein
MHRLHEALRGLLDHVVDALPGTSFEDLALLASLLEDPLALGLVPLAGLFEACVGLRFGLLPGVFPDPFGLLPGFLDAFFGLGRGRRDDVGGLAFCHRVPL